MYGSRIHRIKNIRPGDSVVARWAIVDGNDPELIHAEPGEHGTVLGLPDGYVTVFWIRTGTLCDCDAAEELDYVPHVLLAALA